MKFNKKLALPIFLYLVSTHANALTVKESEFSFEGSISGGMIADYALKNTAGREIQIWKMTEVMLGVEFTPSYSPWTAKIEWLPLADDLCYEKSDSACGDYYKNIGTSLIYYGDYNIREATATYQRNGWSVKSGRMVNQYGLPLADVPYQHRHDAPHAYYLDKELVTGVMLAGNLNRWRASAGVFGGRGDPGTSYNYYLDGDIDPNVKGNNTPLLETTIAYTRDKRTNSQRVYAGYHYTKTGSAVGSLYSGKHNDERFNIGFDVAYRPDNFGPSKYRLIGQYHHYTMGLTTEGVQARGTPEASQDLTKKGFFLTGSIEFNHHFHLNYTYEQLDRMDTLVWDKIAQFDHEHSAFSSVETNNIVSLAYLPNENVTISAFYRQPDYDYQAISGIPENESTDKFGALVSMTF